jgi:hypothetical protein
MGDADQFGVTVVAIESATRTPRQGAVGGRKAGSALGESGKHDRLITRTATNPAIDAASTGLRFPCLGS